MKYCFDLDGTICDTPLRKSDNKPGYLESTPFPFMVEQVNKLYDDGHKIIIMTARGRGSGIDWTGLTTEQLTRWVLSTMNSNLCFINQLQIYS